MNKLALVAAAALSAATFGVAAIAQESDTTQAGDFDNVDANKDQLVSWDEAVGVYPTLTQDLFNQADANGDGSLDEAEFISLEGLTAGLDDDGTEDTQENDSSSQSSAEDNDGGDDNQDTDDNEDDDDEISDEDSSSSAAQ